MSVFLKISQFCIYLGSIIYSLAFPQGMFYTVTSKLLIIINEGERQSDVQWIGPVWSCCPFTGLKCYHQIYPGSRTLDFKLLNKIFSKYFTQELFKFIVHTQGTIWPTCIKNKTQLQYSENRIRFQVDQIHIRLTLQGLSLETVCLIQNVILPLPHFYTYVVLDTVTLQQKVVLKPPRLKTLSSERYR